MMFKQSVAFFVLVLTCLARAQDGNCPSEEDALVAELAEQDYFRTDDFRANELESLGANVIANLTISVAFVRQQQGGEFAPSGELEARIAEEENDTHGEAVTKFNVVQNFHATCPYGWYPIPRFTYYYRTIMHSSSQVVYMYHWTYYPIWQTRCLTVYCRIRYGLNWWDYRYRCFPEYRCVYVWMLKLTIVYKRHRDGTLWYAGHYWSKVLVKLWLRRGCGCRRYWRYGYLQDSKCPSSSYP